MLEPRNALNLDGDFLLGALVVLEFDGDALGALPAVGVRLELGRDEREVANVTLVLLALLLAANLLMRDRTEVIKRTLQSPRIIDLLTDVPYMITVLAYNVSFLLD